MLPLWKISRPRAAYRLIHATPSRAAITKLQMPAMSPTMTEGGIADWKKKEGETFTAGEVLLEIETDKATIDVEAQDDGIMGKIITPNGTKNVPVGKAIALLAQEGDDISSLEIPVDEPTAASTSSSSSSSSSPPQPSSPPQRSAQPVQSEHFPLPHSVQLIGSHDRPFFPSVLRLLEQHDIPDAERIKGTGIRGMLTKGDVLAYLGKASGPNGSFKDNTPTPSVYKSQAVLKRSSTPEKKALDPLEIRQAILAGFLEHSAKARTPAPPSLTPTFESIIADYLPPASPGPSTVPSPPKHSTRGYLDGLH